MLIEYLVVLYTSLFQIEEDKECLEVYYEVKKLLDDVRPEYVTEVVKARRKMLEDTKPKIQELEQKFKAIREAEEKKAMEKE